ncbi:MAG TPA: redox-sensing transcriptional repressor Rex [Planctomycetaceae bacterium]|nr:redox-sensing transcriptional repressor Rex [Planctomycetaceae bacterium]
MPDPADALSEHAVERLIAYRRHLRQRLMQGCDRIYSHDLAKPEGVTPAQVRRDLMTIGYTGSPARGYDAKGLITHISSLLDARSVGGFALVGVGHLGRAILDYLARQHPEYKVAAFDVNPDKAGGVTHGCRCYMLDEMKQVLTQQSMRVGIVTVPADAAQDAATRLVEAGVCGLLNFAPVRLRVPARVYVENVDIALRLEKVAFFALASRPKETQE